MMATCIGQPISWLALEQHALAPRDEAVTAHLAACEACRGCLESIRGDSVVLPALPAAAPRRRWWTWAIPALGMAAAAALALLLVRPRPRDEHREDVTLVKGVGEVVLGVVRERGGAISEDAHTFAPGDRWKVVVTCPPSAHASFDVSVVEDGGSAADHPLAPAAIACGNRVVLPGAFTLTGARSNRVCITVSSGSDSGVACVTLTPE